MPDDLDARVVLDALGLLDPVDAEAIARDLGEADVDAADAAAATYEAATGLALSTTPVDPPPALKAKVLAAVAALHPPTPPGLTYVMADEGWQPHPLGLGIRVKALSVDEARGVATLLLDVPPGTVYPGHHHHGAEECYVLRGDVVAGGRLLGPGDFHHADAGTDHAPLSTVGGATVMLVVDVRDYLAG